MPEDAVTGQAALSLLDPSSRAFADSLLTRFPDLLSFAAAIPAFDGKGFYLQVAIKSPYKKGLWLALDSAPDAPGSDSVSVQFYAMNQHTTHHSQLSVAESIELMQMLRDGRAGVMSTYWGMWLLSGFFFNLETRRRFGELTSYLHLGSLLQFIPGLRRRRAFSLTGELDPKTLKDLPLPENEDLPDDCRDFVYSALHTHFRPPGT